VKRTRRHADNRGMITPRFVPTLATAVVLATAARAIAYEEPHCNTPIIEHCVPDDEPRGNPFRPPTYATPFRIASSAAPYYGIPADPFSTH
jgi:hypothetical protein